MMKNRRAWFLGVPFAVAITAPLRAETSIGTATIDFEPVPPSMNCPSERQLADKVAAELIEMGREGHSAHTTVRVRVVRDGAQLVAQIEAGDQPNGRRHIAAPDCESLGDALAVSIAVILDGQVARGARAREAAVAATSQPQENESLAISTKHVDPATARVERKTLTPSPQDSRAMVREAPTLLRGGWGFWLSGGAGSARSAVVAAGASLDWHPFEARLGAWWQLVPTVEMAPGSVERDRVGGMAAGCIGWGLRLRLLACGHAWLGVEHYAGRGFTQSRSDTVFWGAAGPGIGVETGRRFRIGLDALGLASLMNDRYIASVAGTERNSGAIALWLMARFGLSRGFGPSLTQSP